MPSVITTATQSACLRAIANLTVQLASAWRSGEEGTLSEAIEYQRVIEFAVFGFIGAQISYAWHQFLEETFPVRRPQTKSQQKSPSNNSSIIWTNLIAKLLVDQLFGLPFLNATFLVCTNAYRVDSLSVLVQVIYERLATLVLAGWKLWPAVSLASFLWVPVQWRVIFLNVVGFGWTIFLCLMSN